MAKKAQFPLSDAGLKRYDSMPARGRGSLMSAYVDIIFSLIDAGYTEDTLKSLAELPAGRLLSGNGISREHLEVLFDLLNSGYDTSTLKEMCSPKLSFILKATTGDQFRNMSNPLLQQAMIKEFSNFIGFSGECNEGVGKISNSDSKSANTSEVANTLDQAPKLNTHTPRVESKDVVEAGKLVKKLGGSPFSS